MARISPLRIYRETKALTLDGLATAFGVNKTTIMRWEGGKLPAERVLEVERATGIPRHELRPDLWGSPSTVQESAA